MKWRWLGLACVLALASALALAGGGGRKAGQNSVSEFHKRLDAGDVDHIYVEGVGEKPPTMDHQTLVRLLSGVHLRLGAIKSAVTQKSGVEWRSEGEFVTLTYVTKFTHGSGVERFEFKIEDDGAHLVNYGIGPTDPPLN